MINNSKQGEVLIIAFGVFLLAHPLYLSLLPFRILGFDGIPRFYYIITGLVYLYVALLAYWMEARGYMDFRHVLLASLVGIPLVFAGLILYQGIDRMHLRFIIGNGGHTLFFYPMMLGFVIGRAKDSAEYTLVVIGTTTVAFIGGILMMLAIRQNPLTGFGMVIGIANLIGIALVDGVFGYPLYRLGTSTTRNDLI